MAYLELRDLSLSYPGATGNTPALQDINLSVGQGLICALTGPSGCGKSSLLSLMAGIVEPSHGEVLLEGTALDPKRKQIALVPQNYGLMAWKTLRENIWLPEALGRRSVSPEVMQEIIETLDLKDLLSRYPHQISGGQRQRAALARAFGMQPDLLLLDEPFSALDVVNAERSRQLFLDLWRRYPCTTLIVTHNPEEAIALASEVIVLGAKPGRIMARLHQPSPTELRTQLNNAYAYTPD